MYIFLFQNRWRTRLTRACFAISSMDAVRTENTDAPVHMPCPRVVSPAQEYGIYLRLFDCNQGMMTLFVHLLVEPCWHYKRVHYTDTCTGSFLISKANFYVPLQLIYNFSGSGILNRFTDPRPDHDLLL